MRKLAHGERKRPGLNETKKRDSKYDILEPELYYLIARFLSLGPCNEVAKTLVAEIEKHDLLPKRVDWKGGYHAQTFADLDTSLSHIGPDHLLKICHRVGAVLDRDVKPVVEGVRSLLGAGRQSMLRTEKDALYSRWMPSSFLARRQRKPILPPYNLSNPPNLVQVSTIRQISEDPLLAHLNPASLYENFNLYGRTLGHLSSVYCLTFDRTGRYIITGADDGLVKIWIAHDGRLSATLRGHSAEIADLAVNYENTLLATGSCDKTIRVWCLRSCAPVAILQGHSGIISMVHFSPMVRGNYRHLVSTGLDGCVCFWSWNVAAMSFDPKPIKFIERSRAGAGMRCSSFSPGGIFLATGNSDSVVRVYCMAQSVPEKICELEAHTDRVDSIQYSHQGDRFISGSKDGTARIWSFRASQWQCLTLNMSTTLQGSEKDEKSNNVSPTTSPSGLQTRHRTYPSQTISPNSNAIPSVSHHDQDPKFKPQVTMVVWSCDDTLVATAVNDFTIKIWNSHSGSLIHCINGHKDEVYTLESHPFDPKLLISAGHDGSIFVWDIKRGVRITRFHNSIEGQGFGAIFDLKWSASGHSFAATDSHGHLLVYGLGLNERYQRLPKDMFFHTDYRPLIRDANLYCIDEQTQTAPHLMPPPFLVDLDGNPHPPRYQRLVPGRERCRQEQLIPHIVDGPGGSREVFNGVIQEHEDGDAPPAEFVPPAAPITPPAPVPPSPTTLHDVSLIDRAIERFEQEHDSLSQEEISAASTSRGIRRSREDARSRSGRNPSTSSAAGSATSPGAQNAQLVGMRRTGETEGVRQALGNVAFASGGGAAVVWQQRVVVPPLSESELKSSEDDRLGRTVFESGYFVAERRKKPPEDVKKKDGEGRRHAGAPGENNSQGVNRLATRALYDTETEETQDDSDSRGNRRRRGGAPEEDSEGHVSLQTDEDEQEERLSSSNSNETTDISDWEENDEPVWKWKKTKKKREQKGDEEGEEDGTARRSRKRKNDDEGTKRLKKRLRRRRRRGQHDDEDHEETEEDDDDDHDDDEDDDDDDDGDSSEENEDGKEDDPPRSEREKRKSKWRKSRFEKATSRKTRRRLRGQREGDFDESSSPLKPDDSRKTSSGGHSKPTPVALHTAPNFVIPDSLRLAEWITTVIPRKAPYIPQLGDAVVYFRQGHEQYVNAVHRLKIYDINLNKGQPWHKNPDLREHELVKITAIKYEIHNVKNATGSKEPKGPRLVLLRVQPIDQDGYPCGKHFTVKYHDINDVVDFLVLRQMYDLAMTRDWKVGDRFRSVVEDAWWTGTILSQEPYQPEYPDSMFQCFNVRWENHEMEKMSPWDFEPIAESHLPAEAINATPVTKEEYQCLLYSPAEEDWFPNGQDAECFRLVSGIEQLLEIKKLASNFGAPVCLKTYPMYALIIPYPIDLKTIKQRLENRFYRQKAALRQDVMLIKSNAETFNADGSQIVLDATLVVQILLWYIDDPKCVDIMPLYHKAMNDMRACSSDEDLDESREAESSLTASYETRKRKIISSSSSSTVNTTQNGDGPSMSKRPRRVGDSSDEENLDPNQWKEDCLSVLDDIAEMTDAEPFRSPVDPTEYFDYLACIENPMDLSTVRERLVSDNFYKDPTDFTEDVELIFKNSKRYNTDVKSKIYAMTIRLSGLFKEMMEPVLSRWKKTRSPTGRKGKSGGKGGVTKNGVVKNLLTKSLNNPVRDFDAGGPLLLTGSVNAVSVPFEGVDGGLMEPMAPMAAPATAVPVAESSDSISVAVKDWMVEEIGRHGVSGVIDEDSTEAAEEDSVINSTKSTSSVKIQENRLNGVLSKAGAGTAEKVRKRFVSSDEDDDENDNKENEKMVNGKSSRVADEIGVGSRWNIKRKVNIEESEEDNEEEEDEEGSEGDISAEEEVAVKPCKKSLYRPASVKAEIAKKRQRLMTKKKKGSESEDESEDDDDEEEEEDEKGSRRRNKKKDNESDTSFSSPPRRSRRIIEESEEDSPKLRKSRRKKMDGDGKEASERSRRGKKESDEDDSEEEEEDDGDSPRTRSSVRASSRNRTERMSRRSANAVQKKTIRYEEEDEEDSNNDSDVSGSDEALEDGFSDDSLVLETRRKQEKKNKVKKRTTRNSRKTRAKQVFKKPAPRRRPAEEEEAEAVARAQLIARRQNEERRRREEEEERLPRRRAAAPVRYREDDYDDDDLEERDINYSTRNRGRRTIRYREDSDFEYGHVQGEARGEGQRRRSREGISDGSEEEEDNERELAASSRGRPRTRPKRYS